MVWVFILASSYFPSQLPDKYLRRDYVSYSSSRWSRSGTRNLHPRLIDFFANIGDDKYSKGDYKGAITDYQKAAELYQKKRKIKDYQNALEQVKNLQ